MCTNRRHLRPREDGGVRPGAHRRRQQDRLWLRRGMTAPGESVIAVADPPHRRSEVSVPVMTVPGEPPAPLTGAAVRATGLRKTYGQGETAVHALAGVDVAFAAGEFTAIMGPSGSGKSTLMHCLAGLDSASAGEVWLGDTELTRLRDDELTRLRRRRVGFVFQSFNLLPVLDARENIVLPMTLEIGRAHV